MSAISELYDLAKEYIGDVRKTLEGLNSARSVILEVFNATDFALRQTSSHHDHGDFAKTPDAVIEPHKFNIFGSRSSSNSIATGTEGSVTYGGDGGFALKVWWDNPFIGGNECGAETSGNDGFVRVISSCGGGDQGAEMRYSLLQYGFPIIGAIRQRYAEIGWESSPLGFPLSPETPTFDNVGRRQNFQGGAISWHPQTGAHIVWGFIGTRWGEIGSERFGYPVTDELATPDRRGRFNHFRSSAGDSSIYWTPETGAHEIYGAIRDKWASMGWEKSQLGYPTSSEENQSGGRVQHFQHGSLFWNGSSVIIL